MLPRNKKAKGKALERWVAKSLAEVFSFAYARADSGSGKGQKEDVTVPDDVPFFFECKNQAKPAIPSWWEQTVSRCPAGKIPVLVYKLNFQRTPTVVMSAADFFRFFWTVPAPQREKIKLAVGFDDFLTVAKLGKSKLLDDLPLDNGAFVS